MNTPSKKTNQSLKALWAKLQSERSEAEMIEEDAQMLMFQFLSEVQKCGEMQGLNRKTLAEKIGTSASYLTQIWRGNKPLNFLTIAKMQRVLGICFKIKTESTRKEFTITNNDFFYENIKNYHVIDTYQIHLHILHTEAALYEDEFEMPKFLQAPNSNESKTLTA